MGADGYQECLETIRLDLLNLFGSDYVFEHCITAIRQKRERKQGFYYITDSLRNVNEILATKYGGKYLPERLADIMEEPKEPERSGDEIAADIIRRAGLKTEGGSREHGFNDLSGKTDS